MSILDILIVDVIINIMTYLSDRGKIKFLSLSKNLHALKNKVYYEEYINVDRIHTLWYYDRFTHINFYNLRYTFPKSITHVTVSNTNIVNHIPASVTHLNFDKCFDENIKDCIPNTITHLTFGCFFNRNIKDCILNTVTHLTFGWAFNQDIKNCIPNSVTHLTFGDKFNKNIQNSIPNSVTHLTFG